MISLTTMAVDVQNFWDNPYFDYQSLLTSKSITEDDLSKLRQVVQEKRVQYGNAPIGSNIFKFIRAQDKNIHFILEDFSDDVDALLVIPYPDTPFAVIVLNKQRPLANQIFAAAHEYYHYLFDLPQVKKTPNYCTLAKHSNKREKLASRFAAEFLLPFQALKTEVKGYEDTFKISISKASPGEVGLLAFILSLQYGLPFKASLLRLVEEGFAEPALVKNEGLYNNLRKIQHMLLDRITEQYRHILTPGNTYVEDLLPSYLNVAFQKGLAGYEEIARDAKVAGLSNDILPPEVNYYDDDDDDDDLVVPKIV